jgi:methylated-DNA-protein-cysteine methyltransferase-like protein
MSPKYTSSPNQHAYNALVWEIVKQIPVGKVATYGQIASLIPPPEGQDPRGFLAFGARWVGGAMAACPAGVPWQRVINSQGKISLRTQEAYQEQHGLLEAEGIEFDKTGRINLPRYRWEGPAEEWLKSHGLVTPSSGPVQAKMDI